MPSYQDSKHLLMRTGFGAPRSEIEALLPKSWQEAVDSIVDATPSSPGALPQVADESWAHFNDMANYWLDRSRVPQNQLAEKMVLFWHGTLVSSIQKVSFNKMMFDQNQVFRKKGLGDFDELIHDISFGPAMLRYLDNDQNRKGNPNENFARELMELFTVGVGNYSETDVTESARAWTGETYDAAGNYVFRSERHDSGSKTFLGQRGNLRGSDVIQQLLFGRTAAIHDRFIANKLWSFFAYPNPDDAVLTDIAGAYRASGLNIRETLRSIFMHPKFRSEQARQGIVQSPIEFSVAVLRHMGVSFADFKPFWLLQTMGQIPFYPPNVSGWHQNEAWLTESGIWSRALFVSHARWHVLKRSDLPEVGSGAAAVQKIADYFNIAELSSEAKQVLSGFAAAESDGWHRRSGLMYLMLLTPEMMVA